MASEKVDTSNEACAMACMLVSNPQGELRSPGWQKRVNDLIRALQAERNCAADAMEEYARRKVAAAFDAAAAVDGDHVDVRTVTAYESGFEAGKDEAGDAQWNTAIDAAAEHLSELADDIAMAHGECPHSANIREAEAAVRTLKRV